MKKIIVRKVFAYDPTFNGKYSKYNGYTMIGLQNDSPPIISPQESIKINEAITQIFSSPLRRAIETAEIYKERLSLEKVISLDELKEVKFDLRKLLTEEEYRKFGSNLVRKRFIEGFVNDSQIEKRNNILSRITKLIDKLEKLESGNYLVVSHSFFMKILEIYLKEKSLFARPEKIVDRFGYTRKTFEFGQGFDFKLS